jgi:hypothetical protein
MLPPNTPTPNSMTPGMQMRRALNDAGGINPDEERIGTQTQPPNAQP